MILSLTKKVFLLLILSVPGHVLAKIHIQNCSDDKWDVLVTIMPGQYFDAAVLDNSVKKVLSYGQVSNEDCPQDWCIIAWNKTISGQWSYALVDTKEYVQLFNQNIWIVFDDWPITNNGAVLAIGKGCPI